MADKGNDPAEVWRTMIGEMEKGFNSFANQAMTSPEFSKVMNQVGGVTAAIDALWPDPKLVPHDPLARARVLAAEAAVSKARADVAVMNGGGIRGGQVIGSSTADGTAIADRPVAVNDLFTSVCTAARGSR